MTWNLRPEHWVGAGWVETVSNTFQVLQPEIWINRVVVKSKAQEAEKDEVEQSICRPWVKRVNFILNYVGSHEGILRRRLMWSDLNFKYSTSPWATSLGCWPLLWAPRDMCFLWRTTRHLPLPSTSWLSRRALDPDWLSLVLVLFLSFCRTINK